MRDLNEDLEQKIAARTRELVDSIRVAQGSQEKLQAIVDTALDAVVRMDRQGRIVGWNAQAEKTFGWKGAEVLGRGLDECIVPERHRAAHRNGLARFERSGVGGVLDSRIETYALRRDGVEFPIELAITRVQLAPATTTNSARSSATSRTGASASSRSSRPTCARKRQTSPSPSSWPT